EGGGALEEERRDQLAAVGPPGDAQRLDRPARHLAPPVGEPFGRSQVDDADRITDGAVTSAHRTATGGSAPFLQRPDASSASGFGADRARRVAFFEPFQEEVTATHALRSFAAPTEFCRQLGNGAEGDDRRLLVFQCLFRHWSLAKFGGKY